MPHKVEAYLWDILSAGKVLQPLLHEVQVLLDRMKA